MKLVIKLVMLGSMLIAAVTTSNAYAQTNCEECSGKVTLMLMRYDKSVAGYVEAFSHKGVLLFSGMVASGGSFPLDGTVNYLDRKGTLGPTVTFWVDGVEHASLHTSCSVPIGPGTLVGDFVVLFAFSRNTESAFLCPTGPIPPPGGID